MAIIYCKSQVEELPKKKEFLFLFKKQERENMIENLIRLLKNILNKEKIIAQRVCGMNSWTVEKVEFSDRSVHNSNKCGDRHLVCH